MLYSKGFIFTYGELRYEKLEEKDNSWWVCLDSKFLVKEGEEYILHPEAEKALHNSEGKLNRWGFRMPDTQIKEKYNLK